MIKLLREHYPEAIALVIAASMMLWAIGCEPKVKSLVDPAQQVTRADLQIEIEILIRSYELRNAQLADQEKLRKLIIENALLVAQSGTINPLGLLTGLAAFYGAGTAANNTRKVIQSKIKKPTT